jgi:membrane protease subunit HflC
MSKGHTFIIFVLALGFLLVTQSTFIVMQGQQAMVLQFSKPVDFHKDPGLCFKMPFVQQVKYFENRILGIDPDPEDVILSDRKRIVVDTFGRYKITDMLVFYNTLGNEAQAEQRIDNIINSTAREVLGTHTLEDLLSDKRDHIMEDIRKDVNAAVADKGVEVVDVRIVRADLPDLTKQAVYNNMITDRQRDAAKYRGEGTKAAQTTTAEADKDKTVILANAEKKAQDLRGEGDAEATKIYAEAFKKDPDFYAFYRSMLAYKEGLQGDNTTMILAPDGDFFRYFKDEQGRSK